MTCGEVHPSWIVDLSNSTRFGLGSCGVDDVVEVGAPLPFSLALSTLLNVPKMLFHIKKMGFFGGIFKIYNELCFSLLHTNENVYMCVKWRNFLQKKRGHWV